MNTNNTPQQEPTPPKGSMYTVDPKDISKSINNKIIQADNSNDDYIIGKTANDWIEHAKTMPIPHQLFSALWHEGEVCILYADTNLGKSILAVQIGDSISRGVPIPGFALECARQPVLYFDFEMGAKQFENRYSFNYTQHHKFDNTFIRYEICPTGKRPEELDFEEYVRFAIEHEVIKYNARVVIVDNITYLGTEIEKAKDAGPLMKELSNLKRKYNLSMLILAHTPKRDMSRPINNNDLQGSKVLMNFCDSAFSIGQSFADPTLRYIKQMKQRNTEQLYGGDNVMVCQINKPHNFLHYAYLHQSNEKEHLKEMSEDEHDELEEQIKLCIEEDPGISGHEIARRLCRDERKVDNFAVKVNRIIKRNKYR